MSVYDFGIVPLQQASLCLDCEVITAAQKHCSACGSRALLGIAGVLSRRGSSSPLFSAHRDWRDDKAEQAQDRTLFASRIASGKARSQEIKDRTLNRERSDGADGLARVMQCLDWTTEDA